MYACYDSFRLLNTLTLLMTSVIGITFVIVTERLATDQPTSIIPLNNVLSENILLCC